MADTSFYGATGTTASTQNTIQTSVDAAAASATAASTAQTATEAARDLALGYKNAAAVSETNAAASAVTANQNAANTTAVANIASDVTAVAGIASAVSTTAGISSAISSVAADATDIGAVAAKATQIGLLGTSDAVADMNTLGTSTIVSNMSTLSGISSEISTTAGIASAISTTAGISSAVSSVAADATDIGAVAGKETEIGLLGTSANVTAMGLLGTSANVTAMSNVSGSIANVNTVASNLTSINDFADKYRIGSSDPTSNNDGGDLFYNTSSGVLKVYNSGTSAWEQGVTAGSGFLPLSGGALTGNLTFSGSQTVDGRDLSVDGAKLDGIEASATADQTASEIRALVESASDSNVFTDADHTKLNGIEASATADQTASEILTAVKTVDGASSGLDADLLDGQEGSYYLDANNFSNMPSGYSGWTVSDGSNSESIADGNTLTFSGATYDTSNNTVTITSQTANDFTDADHTKLDGIEASADVTDATNVTAAGAAMLSGATFTGAVTLTNAAPQVRLKDTDVNRQLDVTYGTRAVNFDNEMATGEDMDTVAPWTAFRFIDDSETREVLRVDTAKVTVNKPIEMGSQSVKFGTSKWAIVLDGNDLDFQYNGTTVFKLASNGAVTSADDITAFGSP